MTKSETFQLITPIVALFIPVILSWWEQKAKKDVIYNMDVHIKRLELLEKVKALELQFPINDKQQLTQLFGHELLAAIDFLQTGIASQNENNLTAFLTISRIRKNLLLFRPASFGIFLLQFLFYYSTFGFFMYLIFLIDGSYNDAILLSILIQVVCILFALLFRFLTIRYQLKILKKKTTSKIN